MIQLKICGRAGNQFFQYATAYSYIKENNISEELAISFEELKKRKTDNKSFVDVLRFFNVEKYKTIDKVKYSPMQKILDFCFRVHMKIIRTLKKFLKLSMTYNDYKFIDKIWHKTLNVNGLYYYFPTNLEFYESKSKNIIFWGPFESKKYFENSKNKIIEIFTPKEEKNQRNLELYNVIEKTHSICVTIRRGDFLIDKFKRDFYICTPQYFENAIEKMNKLVNNPQYIVFSDDIEWCKNNMKFPEGTLFETENNPIWEKVRLMYSCKHFIISNSTFSWWVQYLCRNKDKKVIAPNKWNNFEYEDLIYDESWII